MKFTFTREQNAFRRDVVAKLDSLASDFSLEAYSGDVDPRPLYRELAKRGLFGINWPTCVGGHSLGYMEAAIVADEIGRLRIPDTLHLLTIQVVGGLLAQHGSAEQKIRFLAPMAKGDLYAAVLYSEPQAGSDMSSFSGRAIELSDGRFRLKATKVYGLKTRFADFGLCALRTEAGGSFQSSFTLFMIPLKARGVTIEVMRTMQAEQFHRIEIDEVVVPRENVIGKIGQAWPLMIDALALERTGLDYYIKARNWIESLLAAAAALSSVSKADMHETLGRLQAELELGCLQAWSVIDQMDKGMVQDSALAASKWFNSELAQRVAYYACDILGGSIAWSNPVVQQALKELEAVNREAPGLTISGGASEIMLDTIAKALVA